MAHHADPGLASMIARDPRHVFHCANLATGILLGCGAGHLLPFAPATGGAAALQAALTAACVCPRCQWVGANVTRGPARGAVALTFDDGPDPALTPWILATLRAHKARASFFCIGNKARRYPHLIRAIRDSGHSVENHSDRHRHSFAVLHHAVIAREVRTAQQTLTDLAGTAPRFFRAPLGFRNPWLAPVLAECQLRYVSWSRRGFDTVDRRPAHILGRLLTDLRDGDILLLHDGKGACDRRGRPVLHTVLPGLLENVTGRGLAVVDLPTLLA